MENYFSSDLALTQSLCSLQFLLIKVVMMYLVKTIRLLVTKQDKAHGLEPLSMESLIPPFFVNMFLALHLCFVILHLHLVYSKAMLLIQLDFLK